MAPGQDPVARRSPFFSRKRVLLANQRLRLPDGQSPLGLVSPEALDVCEHRYHLLVGEPVAKRRHAALEAGVVGIFEYPPTLTDNAVQEAVRMVPGVPVTIERRRQRAVFFPDMLVTLLLTAQSVADGAV